MALNSTNENAKTLEANRHILKVYTTVFGGDLRQDESNHLTEFSELHKK